jgi:integrase
MTEDLRPVFIVGYHTGARRGEILGIRKDQVDWAAKQIRLNVGETKNGGGRYLPIYGDMIPAIEPLLARPGDRLFTRRASGEPIVNLQPGWLNACTKAGVPNLLFHDLRRSAVRNMTRAGIPREVAMRISGHRTEAMFRRYNVVSEGDIDMAAEKMTAFMSPRAASKSANSYNNGDNSTEVVEP